MKFQFGIGAGYFCGSAAAWCAVIAAEKFISVLSIFDLGILFWFLLILSVIPSVLHALAVFLICLARRGTLRAEPSLRSGLLGACATSIGGVAMLVLGQNAQGWLITSVAITLFFVAPVVLAPFVTKKK